MTKAEILKREILCKYRSVRQFALEMNIPYSTLVTALERGIDGMAYWTVIRICEKLNLNPVDFSALDNGTELSERILENQVMAVYLNLNQMGKDRALEMMEDMAQMDKYRAKMIRKSK
ncbi:MAG: transcriptional regulator [Lachnospiraceae bacterium]|nr:transcriptional regulator [Lachnospiraceae bacterium]